MNLRTGGLVIGYLFLFGAFSNLEAPGQSGIGPFRMYQIFVVKEICDFTILTIRFFFPVASVLAYGAWIYGIMNVSVDVVNFIAKKKKNKSHNFFFRQSTEKNQLDATGIDFIDLRHCCTFAQFNFYPNRGHSLS